MRFQGALVKEQGVTFGIIVVKPHVLNSQVDTASMRSLGNRAFGRIPIILMAQDLHGVPTYSGRRDIVNFLSRIPMHVIPWREYTLS